MDQLHPWQRRVREVGLTQARLARLLGVSENAVSDGLRGKYGDVPEWLIVPIEAWGIMTPDQQQRLEARMAAIRSANGPEAKNQP